MDDVMSECAGGEYGRWRVLTGVLPLVFWVAGLPVLAGAVLFRFFRFPGTNLAFSFMSMFDFSIANFRF